MNEQMKLAILDRNLWGIIPDWFMYANPEQDAADVIADNYCAGFRPFDKFELNDDDSLSYPGDPDLQPLDEFKWNDERIIIYPYSWVAIIQPDGEFVACRLD